MVKLAAYSADGHGTAVVYQLDVFDLVFGHLPKSSRSVGGRPQMRDARTDDGQPQGVSALDVTSGAGQYEPPLIQRHLRDT